MRLRINWILGGKYEIGKMISESLSYVCVRVLGRQ